MKVVSPLGFVISANQASSIKANCYFVIARHHSAEAISANAALPRLLYGACLSEYKILPLHGVRPEQDSSVAVLPQNDKKRRTQDQDERRRSAQSDTPHLSPRTQ